MEWEYIATGFHEYRATKLSVLSSVIEGGTQIIHNISKGDIFPRKEASETLTALNIYCPPFININHQPSSSQDIEHKESVPPVETFRQAMYPCDCVIGTPPQTPETCHMNRQRSDSNVQFLQYTCSTHCCKPQLLPPSKPINHITLTHSPNPKVSHEQTGTRPNNALPQVFRNPRAQYILAQTLSKATKAAVRHYIHQSLGVAQKVSNVTQGYRVIVRGKERLT